MKSFFQLPEELLLSPLFDAFPARESQIRTLAYLLHPDAAPCRQLVVHGTEATGKSAVTEALLKRLAEFRPEPPDPFEPLGSPDLADPPSQAGAPLAYAVVNSVQCITSRHLFERIVGRVAAAVGYRDASPRCETLAQLAVELTKMLVYEAHPDRWRFVLVLDAVDRQRDASPTLLAGLARLAEIIPCLTCVFVVTAPTAGTLRTAGAPHVHFPQYARDEFVRILAASPPETLPGAGADETLGLWTRFAGAVHDAVARPAARTLPALRHACAALWPRFVAPVVARSHSAREFSKLLVAARAHFQDESLVSPGIIAPAPLSEASNGAPGAVASVAAARPLTPVAATGAPASASLSGLLPVTARLLLLAAYLASHNHAKHDLTLFSTFHARRKRRGGGTAKSVARRGRPPKHRKIARKLLGAHAFPLERMTAILATARAEWLPSSGPGSGPGPGPGPGVDADVAMALATLTSLRLLVRVGGGDVLDRGGKWRVNVGWEVVRGVGRSMGVEMEEWLIE